MYYFSKAISEDRLLCLAPLTSRLMELADSVVHDCSGYFLFEQQGRDQTLCVRILAQVHTDEAAFALRDMMELA